MSNFRQLEDTIDGVTGPFNLKDFYVKVTKTFERVSWDQTHGTQHKKYEVTFTSKVYNYVHKENIDDSRDRGDDDLRDVATYFYVWFPGDEDKKKELCKKFLWVNARNCELIVRDDEI